MYFQFSNCGFIIKYYVRLLSVHLFIASQRHSAAAPSAHNWIPAAAAIADRNGLKTAPLSLSLSLSPLSLSLSLFLCVSLTLLLCTCVLRIWSIRSISLRHMQSTRSVRFQLPGKRFASAACTPSWMERRREGGARVDRCLACWFNLLAPNAAGPSTRLAIGKLSLCSAGQASEARMTTGNTGPLISGYMCSNRIGVLRVGVAVSTKDCARKWGIKTVCV